MIAAYIVPIFIILISTAQAINPAAFWRFNQKLNKWQYKNGQAPEPSDNYLRATRIFSSLMAVGMTVVVILLATHVLHFRTHH